MKTLEELAAECDDHRPPCPCISLGNAKRVVELVAMRAHLYHLTKAVERYLEGGDRFALELAYDRAEVKL